MTDETVIAPQPAVEDPVPSLLARRPRRRERLEFALPTINVIFLLMLYFLVAGTIVQKDELSVEPPMTSRVPDERLPRPLLVVTEESLALDGNAIEMDALVAAARDALDTEGDTLNIMAPADMPASSFLDVVAQLSAADIPIRVVTVETEQTGEP